MAKKKIVLCRAGKPAEIVNREDTPENYQSIVGGYIQAIYPFDDEVALVCNEEGVLHNLPVNRNVKFDGGGNTFILGDFFIIGAPVDKEDFASLTDEQAKKYLNMFKEPEFINPQDIAI